MKNIRPYISIDIETTGLDVNKSHILQVGMVFDDGQSPVNELPYESFFIKEPSYAHAEPGALKMNAWIFEEISKKDPKYPVVSKEQAIHVIYNFINDFSQRASDWDKQNGVRVGKMQLAGKNVASFDFPIIKNFFQANLNDIIDHRFIDVGSVAFNMLGYNAGFNKINKELGLELITHDALDDAFAVVKAIRKMNGLPE